MEICVCHAKLFPLVYIRGSLHHMKTGCQHFCRSLSVCRIVISKSGNASWLIMISQEKTVPCFSLKFLLPFDHRLFESLKVISVSGPFTKLRMRGSIFNMFKLEHHIQLTTVFPGIFLCLFNGNTRSFPNCHDIIFGQYLTVHFL